jgi:hypothetical protein
MTPINKKNSCSPLQRATRLGTALVLTAAMGMAAVTPAAAAVNEFGETVTSTTSSTQPYVVGDAIVGNVLHPETGEGWNESVSFQWMRDGVKIEGETWYSYTVTPEDLGKRLSIRITGDSSRKYRDSGQTDPVTYTPVASLSLPKISGTAMSGATLTASAGSWYPSSGTRAYQWNADGVKIAGATAAKFVLTPAQAGKKITVTVTASSPLFRSTSATSAPTAAVGLPSVVNTARPSVTGIAATGQVLTGTPGTWTGATAFDYQWLTDGEKISGANAATYTIPEGMAGHAISLRVTGKAAGYLPVTAESDATAAVTENAVSLTGFTVISGDAVQGKTLTVSGGTWSPSGVQLAYQWLADGKPIPGATGKTFTLTAGQVGQAIGLEIVGTRDGFTSLTMYPFKTKPVLAPLVWGPLPVVTGKPEIGQTLTLTPGTWTAGAALKYQWIANGQFIAGATGPTLTLTSAHVGKKITAAVSGSLDGYRPTSRYSAATAAVTDMVVTNTMAPGVTGSRTKFSTLTARPGTWNPGGVSLSYEWLRNGQSIAGATASTYRLTAADVGQRVTVRVYATKPGYVKSYATAAEGGPVADLYVTSSQNAALSGTSVVGYTLRVTAGTWTTGTAVSYRWLRDGQAISGATGSSYTLTKADAGRRISAVVTGAKRDYVTRTTTSAATGAVSVGFIKSTSAARISGGIHALNRLTAVGGTWNVAGVTVSRQWLRNGSPIAGATGATYDLTVADVGKTITLRTAATKATYRGVTTVSAPTAVILRPEILSTARPALLGSSRAGSNMGVSTGSWNTDKVSLKYQWYANGVAIPGAVYNIYSTSLSQLGKTITVKVTASKSGYISASVVTAGSAPVAR